jgi:hypothetical protein
VTLGDHLGADQDAAPRLAEAGEDAGVAPRSAALSESSRRTGIGASRSASSASIRSVPAPARESVVEAQCGQARGCGSAWAQ